MTWWPTPPRKSLPPLQAIPQTLQVSPRRRFPTQVLPRTMSGRIEDFALLQPRTGTITVAGSTRLPVEVVGSVGYFYGSQTDLPQSANALTRSIADTPCPEVCSAGN